MELATTTRDFSSYTEDQIKIVEYIKKSGFSFVDYAFSIDYKHRTGIYSSDSEHYISKLKEMCEKMEVKLIQSHSPMGMPLADDSEEFIKDTEKCIIACGKLGIKNIVVHSGYLMGLSKKETIEKNKIFYEKLLNCAEKYEVNILTENFNKMCVENLYWIDNASDLLELIELVNHPLFHAVWDTGHANMQEKPQEEEITLLGEHIKALHVHDNNKTSDQHMCPFFGSLDVDSVMKGLKKVKYDGFFTFEAANFFSPEIVSSPDGVIDLELKLKAEELMYETGTNILKNYWT